MSDMREEKINDHTTIWSEDIGHDALIVKRVGAGITAPSPLPSTCTSAAGSNIAETSATDSGDHLKQRHVSLASAWNLDKKRRKWKARLIQRQVWPVLLSPEVSRSNLVAVAPTSSGKTLAYGIPMVCHEIMRVQAVQEKQQKKQSNNKRQKRNTTKNIVGLVLVPTRELCLQIQTQLNHTATTVTAIYGGVDKDDQVAAIKQKPTLVVATPGRFVDILQHQSSIPILFSVETLHYVVLDEADRLAITKDMAEQVDQIFELLGIHRYTSEGNNQVPRPRPKHPMMALFSATAPHQAQQKWAQWVGPNHIHVCAKSKIKENSLLVSSSQISTLKAEADDNAKKEKPAKATIANFMSKIPEHLAQKIQVCPPDKKPTQLLEILGTIKKLDGRQRSLVIVFFREIKTLQKISQGLTRHLQASKGKKKAKDVAPVAELHGKMSQNSREQALQNFRSGKIPILLATDICARGIHVSNVWYIVNYDFPEEMEQYVHRCGRAARNATPKQISARPPATIYSFVNREESTMTKTAVANNINDRRKAQVLRNVLTLLRSTDAQTEDPDLRQLAKGPPKGKLKDRKEMKVAPTHSPA